MIAKAGTKGVTGRYGGAVVIQGRVNHRLHGESGDRPLAPGSYFGASEGQVQEFACVAGDDCLT